MRWSAVYNEYGSRKHLLCEMTAEMACFKQQNRFQNNFRRLPRSGGLSTAIPRLSFLVHENSCHEYSILFSLRFCPRACITRQTRAPPHAHTHTHSHSLQSLHARRVNSPLSPLSPSFSLLYPLPPNLLADDVSHGLVDVGVLELISRRLRLLGQHLLPVQHHRGALPQYRLEPEPSILFTRHIFFLSFD